MDPAVSPLDRSPAPSPSPTVEALFVRLRWPHGPACPFCGTAGVYGLEGGRTPRRRFKCAACRRQFTVTKSTILENSRLSLDVWFRAARVLTSLDGPPSVAVLEERLEVGRTAARNLLERVRYAARRQPLRTKLRDPDLRTPSFGHMTSEALLIALLATPAPTQDPRITAGGAPATDTRRRRRVSKKPPSP